MRCRGRLDESHRGRLAHHWRQPLLAPATAFRQNGSNVAATTPAQKAAAMARQDRRTAARMAAARWASRRER